MFANSLKKKQNPKFGKFSYYFWKFSSVLQLLPRILPRKHCPGIRVKCCPWAVPEPSFKLWSQERPKQHCRWPSSLPIPFYPPFPSFPILPSRPFFPSSLPIPSYPSAQPPSHCLGTIYCPQGELAACHPPQGEDAYKPYKFYH